MSAGFEMFFAFLVTRRNDVCFRTLWEDFTITFSGTESVW